MPAGVKSMATRQDAVAITLPPASSAWQEWRSNWRLPVAAGLGDTLSGLPHYAIGAFVLPLQGAFGWSHSTVLSGLTLCGLIVAAGNMPVGMLIDRIGARLVGLVGIVVVTAAVALLGLADGSLTRWMLLWALVGVGTLLVQALVWTNAVAARFDAARGAALGVTLAGGSLGAAVFPLLATAMIATFGWQTGFPAIAAVCLFCVFPIVFLWFHDGRRRNASPAGAASAAQAEELPGLTLREGLRVPAFYRLLLAGGLFSLCAMGLTVNLVPLLVETGASPLRAASLAGLIGILGMASRLGVGYVLDRISPARVGATIFALPILGAGALLVAGDVFGAQLFAVVTFGIMLGGAYDIIAYLATRHFGLRNFGALLGALVTALALGAAVGPLAAAALRDQFGNYELVLCIAMALMAVCAVTLLGLREPSKSAD